MADQNKPIEQGYPEASALAISEFCPRDGSVLDEGVKYGYPALVCPMCTYWKLRTVPSSV